MKRDKRERRVRETLTVDLGRNGFQAIEHCKQMLTKLARQRCRVGLRPRTQGAVVRIAITALIYALEGISYPHWQAMGLTPDLPMPSPDECGG